MKTICTFLLLSITAATTFAQANLLDPSFGADGIAILQPGSSHDVVQDMAFQSDGKIILGGVSDAGNFNFDVALSRLNADGTLDTNFGTDGWYLHDFNGASDFIYEITVLPDGGILACGAASLDPANTAILVMKFDPNGQLDASFGSGDGYVIHDLGPGEDYAVDMLLIDQAIYLCGSKTMNDFTVKGMLMKLNSDGTIDTSFGNAGVAIGGNGADYVYFNGITYDPVSQQLALAGYVEQNFSQYTMVTLFSSEGDINTSFGTSGYFIATSSSRAWDIEWKNNQLLVAGLKNSATGFDAQLLGFDMTGQLDAGFGNAGVVNLDLAPSDYFLNITFDADGNIYAGGSTGIGAPNTSNFLGAKYNSSGVLDQTFGNAGTASIEVGTAWSEASSILLDSEDRILLGGFAAGANNDMVVVRLGSGSSNIANTSSDSNLNIYPNPAQSQITLNHVDPISKTIQILNILGETVLTVPVMKSNNFSIDISSLQAGLYFIENGNDLTRFVKK